MVLIKTSSLLQNFAINLLLSPHTSRWRTGRQCWARGSLKPITLYKPSIYWHHWELVITVYYPSTLPRELLAIPCKSQTLLQTLAFSRIVPPHSLSITERLPPKQDVYDMFMFSVPPEDKPVTASAHWAAFALKVLNELGRYKNPKANITISVEHLVSLNLYLTHFTRKRFSWRTPYGLDYVIQCINNISSSWNHMKPKLKTVWSPRLKTWLNWTPRIATGK